MHFTSVFPVGIVTCGLFWILYAIDPALVMPDWIAKLIPAWLNHITHTFPVFYIFLDSYFHKRKSPGNKSCWIISAILVFIYFTIIGYVRYYDGYWLYPILTMFAIEHFVISYILAFFGFFLLIKAACLLNNKLHDQTNSKSSAKIGKVKKIH
uniref:Androgen-induced gene 1 protein-like n=1 Tax=Caenorhabditis tropicalis TaxID=1561998 RepID=A0A1I7TLH0_9PELO